MKSAITSVFRCGQLRAFASSARQQNEKLTYGFIGLGQMGHHMASHIARHCKNPLLIHDIHVPVCETFIKNHASYEVRMVDSPKALAREADILITMLPSSPHVQKVYLDEKEGFLSGLLDRNAHAPTPILIDSSTIEPRVSQQVRHAITHAIPKAIAVDAPVSGGILGAEAATLTFMVGASQEEFTRVKPILSWMGKDIVHCGPPGMGQVAKICNNMLLGISMVAVAETLNLGKRLGMDPKILSGIINKSSGRCWSSEVYNPVPGVLPNVPSSRNYAGGFGVHLMAKDMGLAVQAALHSKSSVFLGSLTQQVYDTVHHSVVKEEKETEPEYLYGKDFSVVYKWLSSNDSRNEAPPPPKYLK